MLRSIPKKWFGRCGYNVQNFYMFINNEHDKNMNNRLKNENHRENDRYASYAGISQIPQIELNFLTASRLQKPSLACRVLFRRI